MIACVRGRVVRSLALSLSMGLATSQPGERLEAVVKRADLAMFEAKRRHYTEAAHDRRRSLVAS